MACNSLSKNCDSYSTLCNSGSLNLYDSNTCDSITRQRQKKNTDTIVEGAEIYLLSTGSNHLPTEKIRTYFNCGCLNSLIHLNVS